MDSESRKTTGKEEYSIPSYEFFRDAVGMCRHEYAELVQQMQTMFARLEKLDDQLENEEEKRKTAEEKEGARCSHSRR